MIKEILKNKKPGKLIKNNFEEIIKEIPELKKCYDFDQCNDYHIYDVLEHILHVLDEVDDIYILKIAALFHDIGKPDMFIIDENKVGHFYGHWDKSNEIFNKYWNLFDISLEEKNLINNLIFYHDLGLNDDNIEEIREIFKDDFGLLISLKKADILAQNEKYINRLEGLKKYSNIN